MPRMQWCWGTLGTVVRYFIFSRLSATSPELWDWNVLFVSVLQQLVSPDPGPPHQQMSPDTISGQAQESGSILGRG